MQLSFLVLLMSVSCVFGELVPRRKCSEVGKVECCDYLTGYTICEPSGLKIGHCRGTKVCQIVNGAPTCVKWREAGVAPPLVRYEEAQKQGYKKCSRNHE